MRDTLESTGASAWNLPVKVQRRNALNIFLGLVIVSILSRSTVAQIAIDGRYWKYDGKRVLLLGGWNHGHNPFIDHDTDNDNVLYFTKNGGGSVGLKLDSYPDTTFELSWVNVGTGNWGPTATVSGGSTVDINRPNGSAHWIATIVRQGAGA